MFVGKGFFKKEKSWPNVPKGLLAFMQQSKLELSGGVGQTHQQRKAVVSGNRT